MRRPYEVLAIIIPVLVILGTVLYGLTYLDSLGWRFAALKADLKYAINPPEQQIFIPKGTAITATPTITATERPFPSPTATIALVTPSPTPTATPPPLPTIQPTPLPPKAALSGVQHAFQMFNNCGPANIARALSFWGWKQDQRAVAAVVKPNAYDKNVMPYELEAFVDEHTDYQAVTRMGGDIQMLKALIAAGFPVIVEKGYEDIGFDGWMGHYQLLTAYDDAEGYFIAQDSFKGPNYPAPYDKLLAEWRAFNYTYIVIYPADKKPALLALLGFEALDNYNHRSAERRSMADVGALTGRDLFFALFNQGTTEVALQDYATAASAYDAAFANYARLPEETRPWRMLWYQTGPYYAYFYTGRYQDVIDLATQTLESASDPLLEESYLWRARSYLQLDQPEAAAADLKLCLEAHPDFAPCLEEQSKLP